MRTAETVLGVIRERGRRRLPLENLYQQLYKQAILNDEPKHVYGHRRAVVQRRLAQACEVCGAPESCEVHYVRKLADLSTPGRREKPLWVRRMAARRRKTLVLCQQCHEASHRERPSRRKVTA
jgi:uncharacterized protein YciW